MHCRAARRVLFAANEYLGNLRSKFRTNYKIITLVHSRLLYYRMALHPTPFNGDHCQNLPFYRWGEGGGVAVGRATSNRRINASS